MHVAAADDEAGDCATAGVGARQRAQASAPVVLEPAASWASLACPRPPPSESVTLHGAAEAGRAAQRCTAGQPRTQQVSYGGAAAPHPCPLPVALHQTCCIGRRHPKACMEPLRSHVGFGVLSPPCRHERRVLNEVRAACHERRGSLPAHQHGPLIARASS